MKLNLRGFSKTCVWGSILLVLALSAKGDVASVVNQVSQTSYQNYLDNYLYTHLGQDRGTPSSGHLYFGAQFTTNLSHPTWSDLSTNNITIDGTNNVVVQTKSADAQFYRLLKR